jgi:hypothetical protein
MKIDIESARPKVACVDSTPELSPQVQTAAHQLDESFLYQKDVLRRLGVQADLNDPKTFWLQLWAVARTAGFSDAEFWSLTPRKLFAVLELKACERELRTAAIGSVLESDFPDDGSGTPTSTPKGAEPVTSIRRQNTMPVTAGISGAISSQRGTLAAECVKRGPKTDYETARLVAKIVQSIGEDWKSKLETLCSALDDDKVKRPKTWSRSDDWSDQCGQNRDLVMKAIEHHLENAKRDPETIS